MGLCDAGPEADYQNQPTFMGSLLCKPFHYLKDILGVLFMIHIAKHIIKPREAYSKTSKFNKDSEG